MEVALLVIYQTGNPSVDDTTDEDGNDTWELM